MKKICFLIFLLLFGAEVTAQSFYVSSRVDLVPPFRGSAIYKVTKTASGFTSEMLTTCRPGDEFLSIAMNKNGLYWFYGNTVYRGDIVGNSLINCDQLALVPTSSNALTIRSDGNLYFVSGSLFATNTQTLQTIDLGPMSYTSRGDLCFYKNGLYMAANEGIVKIDLNDTRNSYVYIPMDRSLNVYGLVSVATSLYKNTVYALANTSNNATEIIELDLDQGKIGGVVGSLPYGVLDAASLVEDGSIQGIIVDQVNVGPDCNAPLKGLVEVITQPHIEEFTYTLGTIAVNNTGVFTGVNPGTYQLTITSLSDQQTVSVTVPVYTVTKPVYQYNVQNQVCDVPGKVTFTSNDQSDSYRVTMGGALFTLNHTFSGLTSGTSYHFDLLNGKGCKVDEVTVDIPREKCQIQLENPEIGKECTAVNKGVIKIIVKPHNDPYTYTLNSTSNTTGIFNMVDPGTYMITVTSADDMRTVSVTVPDFRLTRPVTTIRKINPVCEQPGQISFMVGTDPKQYSIRYQAVIYPSDHLFPGLFPGDYHFDILKKDGCIVDELEVSLVQEVCSPVSFPSAFTPNQDGINDLFRADPQSKAGNFRLQVFNKWGAMLFTTTDLFEGWNGKHGNVPVPVDTYYWVATFVTQENKQVVQKGFVALIR